MAVNEKDARTAMLLTEGGVARLRAAHVAVFGIGGVGGYTVEALARCGIGQLDLCDSDTVSVSNLNRQILATHSTVGQLKVEAARNRILDINPTCVVRTYPFFYLPDTADQFDFTQYDYIVDAIDTVTGKLQLVQAAEGLYQKHVPASVKAFIGHKAKNRRARGNPQGSSSSAVETVPSGD